MKITDFGYVVEIAIPFNQLRFVGTNKDKDNDKKQTWGFSIERSYPRNVTHIMISHFRDRNISCVLCQANKLTGFKRISQGRNLEFDPTLTLNRTDQKKDFPGGEMETGETNTEPGLTARWGITSNLIMNAAVNPDFSHVEADAAQLEVNTRFAFALP
jgi:hypothetical protein